MTPFDECFPLHWIGIEKDWLDSRTSISEALVSIPPDILTTHAYVIGATGSGKTTVLHHLMNQDVMLGHSFIVFDMRGDLVRAALELCAGRVAPEKVKLFDLREKERPLGFNPLFGAGESYFRALNVLGAIQKEADSFGVQLAETLRLSLLLLSESGEPLTRLEELLSDEDFRMELLAKSNSQSSSQFWERFNSMSSEKQAAYVSPVMNKVSMLFATDGLRRMYGHQAPVDLGKHLNTPGSVTLISLSVDELHAAGKMAGALFLSAICREVFGRVTIPESERVPIRMFVDEFENFNMDDFEAILAEGRRFKLSLCLAHQTLAQLTPRIRSMILNNVGVKLVFRTGREDSHVLSKDLTGDLKAFDLASFPTGDAVLWTRSSSPIHIEVNEPLFPRGEMSPEAKRFVDELRSLIPPFEVRNRVPQAQLGPKSKTHQKSVESLEDWLA